MSDVTTLPAHGEVFLDARGDDRTLRISWHHESGPDGVVVLSLWRSGLCVGSFRLRSREVPLLIDALARGLGGSWPLDGGSQQPAAPSGPAPDQPAPPRQRPRPVPLPQNEPQPDAGPGPGPGPGPLPAWPPTAPAAPAAQGEPRPRQRPRPRPMPHPSPAPGPQPAPPPSGGPPAGEEPPPQRPQRPQHLRPAAEPPIYNDVQPNPRRYLGGPPNSSGAESWSA